MRTAETRALAASRELRRLTALPPLPGLERHDPEEQEEPRHAQEEQHVLGVDDAAGEVREVRGEREGLEDRLDAGARGLLREAQDPEEQQQREPDRGRDDLI